ncbi:hypothetical protein [Phytohabitans houttuyneae]|uniref:Uncharacterized protein n=1 Tax=Phytohabitans houttuyneae TaxID=1076126 RepID=A0A6V8K2Y3_9ACTN|nr:hypothetical protein [Phytohabitans houttuyneae]GFJ76147.1 hypothetical protein Phou_003270 [Phytohabitans houttuyneae]
MSRETTILEKLRPVSAVDTAWPAEARAAALEKLLRDGTAEPAAAPRRPGRRRLVLTAALTTGIIAAGAGVATAGGLLPESFTGPLSFWTSETGGEVDVQTARRVAQGPGPDGTVLSVWTGRSPAGTVCVAPMFEAPGPIDRPAPGDFRLAGGQCAPPGARPQPFGSLGGSSTPDGVHTTWATAGDAVRAELRLPGGSVRPALFAEGLFFFWYEAIPDVAPPTLVGYDAAGAVVAERQLPDWDRLGK